MIFFDRDREIDKLRSIRELSHSVAQFTVVTGRRRIGKTSLILNAYSDEPFLYFFGSRKVENELCAEYASEIEDKLGAEASLEDLAKAYNVAIVKAEQLLNARYPILVTLPGMVIVVRLVQPEKVPFNSSTLFGKVTVVRPVQPVKA